MKDLNQCKKTFLLRYNAAVKAQNEADDELDALLSVGTSIPVGDGLPKGMAEMSMPERFSMQAEKVREDLKEAFEKYSKARKEVRDAIMGLEEERLIAIMRDRYMNFKLTEFEAKHNAAAEKAFQKRKPTQIRGWEEIAERNGYAYDTVKGMHGEALERLIVPGWWIEKWNEKNAKTIGEMLGE